MVTTMQDSFLNANYVGTKKDYTAPNFKRLGEAYGIKSYQVSKIDEIENLIKSSMKNDNCEIIEIQLTGESTTVSPLLDYSRPFEDMNPYLSREELTDQMMTNGKKELYNECAKQSYHNQAGQSSSGKE
jgi:acetolactate synthase-1/2/3 large subunit